MSKQIIAIIGNADIENDIEKQEISYELGRLIIDNGFALATGGLGGVMEYASKGAKLSKNYNKNSNSIIGILPDYDSESSNEHIDIAIPTGVGLARNLILISMANAVVAVGGGSGTLNEISAAWQMQKLIIGLKVRGWSGKLCGKSLDDRRDDIVFCAKHAKEVIAILKDKLPNYQRKFKGVGSPKIGKDKAKKIIISHFKTDSNLFFLGQGTEGSVFTDKEYVYKVISQTEQPLELYWKLLSMSEKIHEQNNIVGLPEFKVSFSDNNIFIKYKFKKTRALIAENQVAISIDKFIALLKEFYKIGWSLADFKPKNLRLTKNGDLLLIDIGKSILPISDYLFKSMCRRAFVSYKLQDKITKVQEYNKYLSSVNEEEDFSLMTEFGLSENELKAEFDKFYDKVLIIDKKEVLNPIIRDIFQNNIKAKNVLDYGSGYGDMSKLLFDLNLSVTAYEPDKKIVDRYKDKYYRGIDILDSQQLKQLITEKKTFDGVLCSLVLCHKLAKTKQERLDSIEQIMTHVTALSNNHIVIVICNPLYTYQPYSTLQERILPDNFIYTKETEFKKEIYSSGKKRVDIHRPLSFYENLFDRYHLEIQEIIQTNDKQQTNGLKNSDFMIFFLKKNNKV